MRDVLQVMVAMACRLLPLVRSMAEMERSSKYSPLLRRRSPVGHSCPVWRAGRAEAARGPVALLRGCGTAPRAQVYNSCSDVPPSRTYSLCTVLWPCCLRCKNSMLGAFCLLRVPSGGLEPEQAPRRAELAVASYKKILDLNRLSIWTGDFCTYYRELRTIEYTYYREMTVMMLEY